MVTFVNWLNDIMTGRIGMKPGLAGWLDGIIALILLLGAVILVNWGIQSIYRAVARRSKSLHRWKLYPILSKQKLGHRILLVIPGIVFYVLCPYTFGAEGDTTEFLLRCCFGYMVVVAIMICNSGLSATLDVYSQTEKNKTHPLKGLMQGLQIVVYLVGGIILVSVLFDKSPTVLLTGLGASAAVLMLIFKDSILGFVAGVQLSQNNMIRIGDWIQLNDGSANGVVEEITLNTVKVRNWDNTLSMIPPYTLVSAPFKNWRGMQESGGRRVDKCIYIDMTSLEVCSGAMIERISQTFPIMKGRVDGISDEELTTNIQLYRTYIEVYLRQNPKVNTELDLIVSQREATAYGLPIEVYFFTREKAWAVYEKQQSDIFDHLMTAASDFGLRIYQRP